MIDSFGRKHDYLRISLTEKCNLRCVYCMPENGVVLKKQSAYMSADEVVAIAKEFVNLGVKKIRLTGGEPMVHKEFREILAQLSLLPVELTITTNAVLVDRFLEDLKSSSIKTINVSLDSLRPKTFLGLTKRDELLTVLQNIHLLKQFFKVKINAVLIKDQNDSEIIDFVEYALQENLEVRFIEFMPFDGNKWNRDLTVGRDFILDEIAKHYSNSEVLLHSIEGNETAQFVSINGEKVIGTISTITNPFCDSCNRLRLTADGKLKNCLFSNEETDLLTEFRNGKPIEKLVLESLLNKKKALAGLNFDENLMENRAMVSIGG